MCASQCAWWLGLLSLSGRPGPRPGVPALSLPPVQGSLAASASAYKHNTTQEDIFSWVNIFTTCQPPERAWVTT